MATEFCGYSVSEAAARAVRTRLKGGQGIIKDSGSLTGENQMFEPSQEQRSNIERLLIKEGYDPALWRLVWAHLVDERGRKHTVLLKNEVAMKSDEEWMLRVLESAGKRAPKYPVLKPKKLTDRHLHAIDIADLHLGKDDIGHAYSLDVARERAEKAVQSLLDRGSGYNIDQFLLPVGNDVLHVDGKANTTTGGTPQQVNAHWTEMWEAGFHMYVSIIERLGQVAPVHIVYNRANHAEHLEWTLVKAVQARLTGMKHATWDINRLDRSCYVYGNNFIGTVHGDKAKLEKLPALFSVDYPREWGIAGTATMREILVHHVHHGSETVFKPSKDYPGIRVNTMRSLSPTDDWHHDAGYIGVPRSVESIVYHKEFGLSLIHI